MNTLSSIPFSDLKRQINLAEYASTYGYNIDRKKSTKTSILMKTSNDKIVITRKNNLWVYFSVFNDSDSGTIVDFVKNRSSKSLQEIGRELASWSGLGTSSIPTYQIQNQSYDQSRVKNIFKKCQVTFDHPYLESRGLPASLLRSKRFSGRIYSDRYGNVVFPHYDKKEVCGLELKNTRKGLLVKGSKKTFWRSDYSKNDQTLVITEAVIDALSYHWLFTGSRTFYLATGGGVSQSQCELLVATLRNTPNINKVVIATDHDEGGERIAQRLFLALQNSDYGGAVKRHPPPIYGQDWNDVLCQNYCPKFGTPLLLPFEKACSDN